MKNLEETKLFLIDLLEDTLLDIKFDAMREIRNEFGLLFTNYLKVTQATKFNLLLTEQQFNELFCLSEQGSADFLVKCGCLSKVTVNDKTFYDLSTADIGEILDEIFTW